MKKAGMICGTLSGILAGLGVDPGGVIYSGIILFVLTGWFLTCIGKESFDFNWWLGLCLVLGLPVITCGILRSINWTIVILITILLSAVYVCIDLHRRRKPSKDLRIFERQPIYHTDYEELE